MDLATEFQLSFYKEIDKLGGKENIRLVRHVETGKIYVRKDLSIFDYQIYETLSTSHLPQIPTIILCSKDDEALIIIEDYINGISLEKILETRRFTAAETSALAEQLCSILKPLHDMQPPIIHRDIKPSNLILDDNDNLYLIDFNASKRVSSEKSRDTVLMGTTDYAAPEQFGFSQSDVRTDIFAIGVLMNKMITGRLPSEGLYNDGFLGDVISKCIAIDPANRYQSVDELRCELQHKLQPSENGLSVNSPKHITDKPRYIRNGLPGFRQLKLSHMLPAGLWYIALLYFSLTGEMTDHGIPLTGNRLWFNKIFFCIALLLPTLFIGNFRGWASRMPWSRISNTVLRHLCDVAFGFIIFVSCAIVLAATEAVLY